MIVMDYVGIDLAKDSFDVMLLPQEDYGQFDNTRKGDKQLLKWLTKRVSELSQVHVIMEATNIYWEELAQYLHEQGLKVSVVNPAAVKGFGISQLQRNKTDKVDSRVIALFGQQTQPRVWQPPLPHQRKLRALVRHKQALIKSRTQQQNRLASCLDPDVKASLQTVITALEQQLAHIQQKIEPLIDDHDDLRDQHHLITSIKGIGSDTATLILAEFYDLAHYTSAKAVAADAGVTPAKYESGTSVRRKARMSRIGKSAVRGALFWPAQTAIRWNPIVADLAERLRQRGKPFGVILVAAMRKLLHLIFGVVKNKTPFDPNFEANRPSLAT
jgi:transposase